MQNHNYCEEKMIREVLIMQNIDKKYNSSKLSK